MSAELANLHPIGKIKAEPPNVRELVDLLAAIGPLFAAIHKLPKPDAKA